MRRGAGGCGRSPAALLVLVVVLASCRLTAAGLFDSYMVSPSWQEVVHPPAGSSSLGCATANATSPCDGSADGGAADGPGARALLQAGGAAANPLRLQPPYNVCVSSWTPMVRCTPDTDQAEFKGYQIELFRMLAKEVGWPDNGYFFTCIDHTAMMADLLDPAGDCSLSAAGVEVSPAHIAAGLKFSWPTYKSGLRVLVHTHLQSGSTWAFASIFAWQVWVLLGCTAVAVGLLVGLLERINCSLRGHKHKGWQSWQWDSLAKMMHVVPHVGDPGSDASRVLTLGYGFLVLVAISMYTATAASRLTASALVHPVHSQKDLAGPNNPFTVQTWEGYTASLLAHHNITAAGKPWEGQGDLTDMIAALQNGTATALILDAPVLEHIVGTNDACDLFLVGTTFDSFSLALAFPAAFDDAALYEFSKNIVKLQTYQGALDMLENVYIRTGGASKCFNNQAAGGHGSGEAIELRQVSGLWYILLMCVGVACLLTIEHNVRKGPRKGANLGRFGSFFGGSTGHPSSSDAGHSDVTPFGSEAGHSSAPALGGRHRASSNLAAGPGASRLQPQPGGAPPRDKLSVFLGSGQEDNDDDEMMSPSSPQKMPARLQ